MGGHERHLGILDCGQDRPLIIITVLRSQIQNNTFEYRSLENTAEQCDCTWIEADETMERLDDQLGITRVPRTYLDRPVLQLFPEFIRYLLERMDDDPSFSFQDNMESEEIRSLMRTEFSQWAQPITSLYESVGLLSPVPSTFSQNVPQESTGISFESCVPQEYVRDNLFSSGALPEHPESITDTPPCISLESAEESPELQIPAVIPHVESEDDNMSSSANDTSYVPTLSAVELVNRHVRQMAQLSQSLPVTPRPDPPSSRRVVLTDPPKSATGKGPMRRVKFTGKVNKPYLAISKGKASVPKSLENTPWASHYRNPPTSWEEWPNMPDVSTKKANSAWQNYQAEDNTPEGRPHEPIPRHTIPRASSAWQNYQAPKVVEPENIPDSIPKTGVTSPIVEHATTRSASPYEHMVSALESSRPVVQDPIVALYDEKMVARRKYVDVPYVAHSARRAERASDRVQHCPICREKVTHLRAHANARHLPWYVDYESACSSCWSQFNRHTRRSPHVSANHPEQQGTLTPAVFQKLMAEMFDLLAEDLGVSMEELPGFAKRRSHTLECFTLDVPEFLQEVHFQAGEEPYDPTKGKYLRDLCHWRVVLWLMSDASQDFQHMCPVHSYVPEEGYIFLGKPRK